jgi:hypothetical protein
MKNPLVFLGGTCNGSKWRDELIPLLSIDYFNPLVEDWTPACQAEEIRQRETADYVLYVITPEMKGVYGIAKLIEDSIKRPHKTLIVGLRYYGGKEFDDDQWKSLNSVLRMADDNGALVFGGLHQVAYFLGQR